MLDGLDHVWKAAQILASRDALLKDRLKEAAGEFALALLQPEEWPTQLLTQAHSLREQLKGVDGLEPTTARQVAEELLSLAADVRDALKEQVREQKERLWDADDKRDRQLLKEGEAKQFS